MPVTSNKVYYLYIIHIILVLFLFFTSCNNVAFRFFYNSLDVYAIYKINSYFDINTNQREFLKERISIHHKWHRHNVLPIYKNICFTLKEKLQNGLSIEDIVSISIRMEKIDQSVFTQLLDDIILFLSELDDEQISYIANRFEKLNKEKMEKINIPLKERIDERLETNLKYLSYIYGEFNDYQKGEIKNELLKVFDIGHPKLEFSKKRQEEFLELLNSKPDKDKIRKTLSNWFSDYRASLPENYREKIDLFRKQYFKFIIRVNRNIITKKQNNYSIDRCNELINIIDELEQY